ncbi:MAG: carboxypeptidase-like regulatory domain-containing protein [Ferruginibacter sp.]
MRTGRRVVFSISALIVFLFFLQTSIAQTAIKGKIIYSNDDTPAASVSIELEHDKSTKVMSDNAGNFHLNITEAQKQDNLLISSVGYKTIKMPVAAALGRSTFTLSEVVKTIEGVTVFNSHEVIGSTSEIVGYYRSWTPKRGGEIGRMFKVQYKKFKIDKIRFKASNTCDTCLVRLHIRSVEKNGEPGDELLADSISLFVHRLSLDSKVSEFDLTPYDLTFSKNEFFVGIELLNCGNGKKGSCAFNFAGTEKGEYIFKSSASAPWQSTDDYTIYLKLFLRF